MSDQKTFNRQSLIARLKWHLITIVIFLAAIWILPVFLPEESGWRLGLPFQVFYTAIAILGAVFFYLLESPTPSTPKTTFGIWFRISAVFLATVGFLVLVGMVFPQFQLPEEQLVIIDDPVARGEAQFLNSATTCILCHAVDGQGGTRGPDMAEIGTRAATQVEGLTAEEYIRQSIQDPTAFVVEGFEPIMPPGLAEIIGDEPFEDIVAYLLSLK
ncbi:MAG: cytochrome c [Chloroflexi bacterium]|nr:cytochrome c [Chloroflexota bacterium]